MNSANNTMARSPLKIRHMERYEKPKWIGAIVISSMCIMLSTWVFISFLFYGLKHQKFSKSNGGYVLYRLASVAAVSVLAFLISILVVVNVGFLPGETTMCNVVVKISIELLVTSNSLVYFFLWTKQATLYQSPLLQHLKNTLIKVLSYSSIIMMVVGQHLSGIIFNVLNTYEHTACGCRYKGDYIAWPALVATSVNAIGQALMLFLLLYPFHCAKQRHGSRASLSIVKRTTITTLICVLTDAAAAIVNKYLPQSSRKIPLSIYGLDVTANLMAVLLTYETWKTIVTSPFGGSEGPKN